MLLRGNLIAFIARQATSGININQEFTNLGTVTQYSVNWLVPSPTSREYRLVRCQKVQKFTLIYFIDVETRSLHHKFILSLGNLGHQVRGVRIAWLTRVGLERVNSKA